MFSSLLAHVGSTSTEDLNPFHHDYQQIFLVRHDAEGDYYEINFRYGNGDYLGDIADDEDYNANDNWWVTLNRSINDVISVGRVIDTNDFAYENERYKYFIDYFPDMKGKHPHTYVAYDMKVSCPSGTTAFQIDSVKIKFFCKDEDIFDLRGNNIYQTAYYFYIGQCSPKAIFFDNFPPISSKYLDNNINNAIFYHDILRGDSCVVCA